MNYNKNKVKCNEKNKIENQKEIKKLLLIMTPL